MGRRVRVCSMNSNYSRRRIDGSASHTNWIGKNLRNSDRVGVDTKLAVRLNIISRVNKQNNLVTIYNVSDF